MHYSDRPLKDAVVLPLVVGPLLFLPEVVMHKFVFQVCREGRNHQGNSRPEKHNSQWDT